MWNVPDKLEGTFDLFIWRCLEYEIRTKNAFRSVTDSKDSVLEFCFEDFR